VTPRRRKWEEWKREELEACPPRERKAYKKILDSIPMPTAEDDRRVEEARKVVESVFGKPETSSKRMVKRGKK